MRDQIHFLNGDALMEQFPKTILGKKLICRECLVEGPVKEKELTTFFIARAKYLNNHYQKTTIEEYNANVADQFYQLQIIANTNQSVNLWFEDDLFCQVNLWFTLSLLHQLKHTKEIYLVRPPKHTPYGFGGLKEKDLHRCFENKISITKLSPWKNLWEAYRKDKLTTLVEVAKSMTGEYGFVFPAVSAHIARFPTQEHDGRPRERLKAIIKELETTQFGPVFQAFCETEAIYGFGDLTVKRLLDEVLNEMNNDDN